MKDQSFDEHSAKSSNSDLGTIGPDTFHEPFQEPGFKPHFRSQMLSHVISMVWCPVSCALPVALFHRIARDHIDPDTINVEFQIGMFSITIDRFSMDSFSNCWEDFLGPLLPLHCWGKGAKMSKSASPLSQVSPPEDPWIQTMPPRLASSQMLLN